MMAGVGKVRNNSVWIHVARGALHQLVSLTDAWEKAVVRDLPSTSIAKLYHHGGCYRLWGLDRLDLGWGLSRFRLERFGLGLASR